MKNARKITALLLACTLIFTLFLPGCGQKKAAATTVQGDSTASTSNGISDGNTDNAAKNDQGTNNGQKKKIVVLQEELSPADYDPSTANILKTLESKGYNKQNSEITQLYMSGDKKMSAEEVVKKIKDIKPDVVAITIGPTCNATVVKPLEDSGIPIVTGSVEFFTEPHSNITGITSMPKDLQANAFKLLDKTSPLKGKKAVFLTVDGFFVKGNVQQSFKNALNMDLKEYHTVQYIDEWKDAIKKYNEDSEVGWVLLGVAPSKSKDGSGSQLEVINWTIPNLKKPTVTYWESPVAVGFLCGLGVDIPSIGIQIGDMAARILNGEKVENIKAEEPKKINIVLNQKNAEQLGINFPAEILGSAYRIYTDYNGSYKK